MWRWCDLCGNKVDDTDDSDIASETGSFVHIKTTLRPLLDTYKDAEQRSAEEEVNKDVLRQKSFKSESVMSSEYLDVVREAEIVLESKIYSLKSKVVELEQRIDSCNSQLLGLAQKIFEPTISLYSNQFFDTVRYPSSGHINHNVLEQQLRQQQIESEEDSRWLLESETNLRKRLSTAAPDETDDLLHQQKSLPTSPLSSSNPQLVTAMGEMTLAQSGNGLQSSTGSLSSSKSHSPATSLNNTLANQQATFEYGSDTDRPREVHQNPTANLDRTNDKIYACTTDVVRAVMSLSQGVQQSQAHQYLDLVKKVGLDLRALLASVDQMVVIFPPSAIKEVEMAHKVLSKDMANLVSAMKLAQQYSSTTLDGEYRKGMLAAAHVLAMDSKNLLDVVDAIRIRHPELNHQPYKNEDYIQDRSDDSELSSSLERPEKVDRERHFSPTPVTCSFVPVQMYSNQIQTAAVSSSLNASQVDS